MAKEQDESNRKTQMYCPHCNAIRRCKSSNGKAGSLLPGVSHHSNQVFRRTRTCFDCETSFDTVEILEENVQQLINIRGILMGAMGDLAEHIEIAKLLNESTASLAARLENYNELFPDLAKSELKRRKDELDRQKRVSNPIRRSPSNTSVGRRPRPPQ
jgi:hypothetical protein